MAHVIAVSPHVDEIIEMTSTPGPAGLAEIYERHHEAVFRAALRVTGNPADAEDVLQTVFLRVLSGAAESGASSARSAAYFRRAAVNAAVDLLRRRAVRASTTYDDEAAHAATEPTPLLKQRLRRALANIDPDDASLFLLRFVEGLSNQELADMFQLEKNNIAVRLHRIRLRLQAEMER